MRAFLFLSIAAAVLLGSAARSQAQYDQPHGDENQYVTGYYTGQQAQAIMDYNRRGLSYQIEEGREVGADGVTYVKRRWVSAVNSGGPGTIAVTLGPAAWVPLNKPSAQTDTSLKAVVNALDQRIYQQLQMKEGWQNHLNATDNLLNRGITWDATYGDLNAYRLKCVQQVNIANNAIDQLSRARDYAQSKIAYNGRTGTWPGSGGNPGNNPASPPAGSGRTGVLGVELGP